MQPDLFEFYKSIIPDHDAFLMSCESGLATTFWLNPLKTQRQVFASDQVISLPWHPKAFRYKSDEPLGKTWPYKLGLIQIQEEVSMLPVKLLDPKPHERVLDMCAAPGNKTAEIAVAMENTGTVVANDRNYQRIKALGQAVSRLGLTNITVTVQDALNYQSFPNYFDKILVDAPCSCEGTFRKRPHKPVTPNPRQHRHLASQQIAIIKKAIALCKPGGRIVYSTCTFSPEENEAVVTAVLNRFQDQVRIKPIKLDNFIFSEGVLAWHDQTFHPDVKHTMRVWPYQNDSGGFYVAVFEKLGPLEPNKSVEKTVGIPDVVNEISAHYDVAPDVLNQFEFVQSSQRGIYMFNRDHCIPDGLSHDISGMLYTKTKTNYPKLTTAAAGVLGQHAKKNIVNLDESQFKAYLSQEDVVLDQSQLIKVEKTGFVLVKFQGYVAGVGLFLSETDQEPMRLRSMFPKSL